MATSKLQALWNHPAGPKTVHFWDLANKWCIGIANIADFQKPPETISYFKQMAITAHGLIWAFIVTGPGEWNLFSVSLAMAATSIYQLTRRFKHDYAKVLEMMKMTHLIEQEA